MPKIDIAAVPVRERTAYPPPYADVVKGRLFQALGDAAGLTQFGVNLVRLKPGAASSQRHWHENEDEFLIVLEGELVLVEDEGETILRAGDVVGSRAPAERAHYPDIDLLYEATGGRVRYTNRAGEPFA